MEEQNQVVEQQTEQVAQPAPAPEKPNLTEINIHAMRKKLEAEERARKEYENRAAQAERALAELKAREAETSYVDEDKQELEMLKARLNQLEVEQATSKMSDFNELVTDENLKTLQRLYPDEYQTLTYNPDVKSRAKVAYNLLKNYGIVESQNKKNQERIQENMKKPSAASLGAPQAPETPLAKLDDYGRRILTDEERDKIMKEVARKRRMS